MGKEGELWDDSALVKAFDDAISKYKTMHGIGGARNTKKISPDTEADNGTNEFLSSTEHVQKEDYPDTSQETTTKIGEITETFPSKEEVGYISNCVGSSNTQDANVLPTKATPDALSEPSGKHTISSDINNEKEAIQCSSGPEEYSELLNKYYEVEGQRQQILQQLDQYSNWYYQYPNSSASTAEEYQKYVAQPYYAVTCYCPYGCQNWVIPSSSLPTSCSDATCMDNNCQTTAKGSQHENLMPPEDPDFVKTAMAAVEKGLSLTEDADAGKDKELGLEIGHFPESESATDLHMVFKAWYSAGFYTGKYLAEQSLQKKEHSQNL